ncbi:MAG: cache domain-containing protein [Anaerolineae bacterium]|nr:cache domain-containing protein [Anaerolineae bacterium]
MPNVLNALVASLRDFFDLRGWRIRRKLTWLLLLLSVVPSALLGAWSFNIFRNVVTEQATSNLYNRSVATAQSIDQYLRDRREDVITLSRMAEVVDFATNPSAGLSRANAIQALRATATRTDYEAAAIIGIDGKIILSSAESDVGLDVSFRPFFIEARKGTPYISDPSVSAVTGRPAIFFSAPIFGPNNQVVGVAAIRLSLDGIWSLVERDKDVAGRGSYGLLLDENGIRIANSLSLGRRSEMEGSFQIFTAVARLAPEVEKALIDERRFGPVAATGVRVVPIPELANALVTPGIRTFETSSDINPERHLAAITNLSNKPWRYVIMSPFSSFFGEIEFWATINRLVIGLLVLAVILISFIVAQTFTAPINRLTQVAERISLGELDAKIELDRRDEIGELAEAIARMQLSLQAAIERLRARRAGS